MTGPDQSAPSGVPPHGRLARLIDALPLATVAFDGGGRVVSLNHRAEALFGAAAPGLGEDELVARARSGEEINGLEVQRRAWDGRTLDLAVFCAPLPESVGPENGFLFLFEDIGERRQAERERDEAERRHRELIEALPLVTYVDKIDADATNVYTSPQVTDVLGWSPEDWTSDPGFFARILHPDDRDWVRAATARTSAAHEPFDAEYRLLHRDGRSVWVHDRSTILEDASGESFAQGFLIDVTERKRLEEQLVQAEKMQAIGHLAGGVAHDFNNLLTAIGGYADRAASASRDPAVLQSLDGVRSAVADATSLTSRLLAFNTRDVPAQESLDLNELIRASAGALGGILGRRVLLKLHLDSDAPAVRGEPAPLRQVLVNLAVNALDATEGDGVLTIETARAETGTMLRVSDTGSGMDAETRGRAFEPFFTTKPQGEATGLGLSVVYGVVDSLGGTIQVESTPGAGTAVEILLPAATIVQPATERAARPGERVLVVEDRALLRDLVRDALTASGYEVTAAAGGDEALALNATGHHFDLLLTDVVMPEMSGPELARALRATQPELHVLYMSGYTDDVLDPAELAEPAVGFVRKPFTLAELDARVDELLSA